MQAAAPGPVGTCRSGPSSVQTASWSETAADFGRYRQRGSTAHMPQLWQCWLQLRPDLRRHCPDLHPNVSSFLVSSGSWLWSTPGRKGRLGRSWASWADRSGCYDICRLYECMAMQMLWQMCHNQAPGHTCMVVVAMGCRWRWCDNA